MNDEDHEAYGAMIHRGKVEQQAAKKDEKMTQDEALKRALMAYEDNGGDDLPLTAHAYFLASLRESGWTLAPVEATEAIKKVMKECESGKWSTGEAWKSMIAAAQEDESNG